MAQIVYSFSGSARQGYWRQSYTEPMDFYSASEAPNWNNVAITKITMTNIVIASYAGGYNKTLYCYFYYNNDSNSLWTTSLTGGAFGKTYYQFREIDSKINNLVLTKLREGQQKISITLNSGEGEKNATSHGYSVNCLKVTGCDLIIDYEFLASGFTLAENPIILNEKTFESSDDKKHILTINPNTTGAYYQVKFYKNSTEFFLYPPSSEDGTQNYLGDENLIVNLSQDEFEGSLMSIFNSHTSGNTISGKIAVITYDSNKNKIGEPSEQEVTYQLELTGGLTSSGLSFSLDNDNDTPINLAIPTISYINFTVDFTSKYNETLYTAKIITPIEAQVNLNSDFKGFTYTLNKDSYASNSIFKFRITDTRGISKEIEFKPEIYSNYSIPELARNSLSLVRMNNLYEEDDEGEYVRFSAGFSFSELKYILNNNGSLLTNKIEQIDIKYSAEDKSETGSFEITDTNNITNKTFSFISPATTDPTTG